MKTDSQIQQDVLRELKWDTRVDETEVGVSVDNAIVTLTGSVSSFGKRQAAQAAAHRVDGVLDVANDIEVKVPGTGMRTDSEIAGAVRHALEWDTLVPDARIRSTVSNGIVTLEGDVDFWTQREDAEKAILNLAGVRGVQNKLEIKSSRVVPLDVRESIEGALERRAHREAKRVRLDVMDGNVDVYGTVHSWAEHEAVIGAAMGTHGVKRVSDHLKIEPYSR